MGTFFLGLFYGTIPFFGTFRLIHIHYLTNRHNNEKIWNRTGIIVEARDHGQSLIKMDGSGRLSLRSRQHLKPFLSYSPNLGTSTNLNSDAPAGLLSSEPLPSRPESVSSLPREASPGRNSSSESLFFSSPESPEPRFSQPKFPASTDTMQLSSGSETASPPTSSQLVDPRSPAKALKDAEEEAPKKARGHPKKTTTTGSAGLSGGHNSSQGSPTDGSRDRSSSGSRSPIQTRRSTRPRGPPDRFQCLK